jgi:predicted transcriptional regulator
VTRWDLTRAVAQGLAETQPLSRIMTSEVITASPDDSILELVRKLEHHDISAMPVVAQGDVLGMVSADLLARRSLLRLLQSQTD